MHSAVLKNDAASCDGSSAERHARDGVCARKRRARANERGEARNRCAKKTKQTETDQGLTASDFERVVCFEVASSAAGAVQVYVERGAKFDSAVVILQPKNHKNAKTAGELGFRRLLANERVERSKLMRQLVVLLWHAWLCCAKFGQNKAATLRAWL